MAEFNKYKVSKELEEMAIEVLEIARHSGKIKKGINEVTKSIERGQAQLVYIADNVEPPQIVMHLPPLCKEKNVPFLVVGSKENLGKYAGIQVAASSVAIIDPGDGKKLLKDLIEKLSSK